MHRELRFYYFHFSDQTDVSCVMLQLVQKGLQRLFNGTQSGLFQYKAYDKQVFYNYATKVERDKRWYVLAQQE